MKDNIILDQFKRGKYEYINEVYPDGSHQYEISRHAAKSIYFKDINSSPDGILNYYWVLGCCGNCGKMKIPESEKSSINMTTIFHIFEYTSNSSNNAIQPLK